MSIIQPIRDKEAATNVNCHSSLPVYELTNKNLAQTVNIADDNKDQMEQPFLLSWQYAV